MKIKAFLVLLMVTICCAEPPVYGVPIIHSSYPYPPSIKESSYGPPHQNYHKSSGHASSSQNLLVHGSPHIPVVHQQLPHQSYQPYQPHQSHHSPSYIGSGPSGHGVSSNIVHSIPHKSLENSYLPSVSHAIPSSSYGAPLGSHHQHSDHAVSSQKVVLQSPHQHESSYNSPSLSHNLPLGSLGHSSSPHSNSIYPAAHSSLSNSHYNDDNHYGLAPYKYEYQVDDHHTGDHKSHSESSDGHVVKGQYSLLQPDGKLRTVSYQADKHSGFNAQVSYSYQGHHQGY